MKMDNHAFEDSDSDQWNWQVSHPYIGRTEKELLFSFRPYICFPFLEVGCGQGTNLVHLGEALTGFTIGIDLSLNRLRYSKKKFPKAIFICARAEQLPIRTRSIGFTLIRDGLHHFDDPLAVLRDVGRMSKDSASAFVLEPNGMNPLMAAWAIAAKFDRGILKNSPKHLRTLFSRANLPLPVEFFSQALPISRVFFHYRFGFPNAAKYFSLLIRFAEKIAEFVLPRKMHAYLGYLFPSILAQDKP